ncbi:hypothetical protein SLA2020_286060 [Shorea laevis]
MACGDGSDLNVSDSFSTVLKLRPFFPVMISPIFTPPYRNCTHYTNLFSLNHHPAGYVRTEESRTNFKRPQPLASCSRWNPTKEQLMALEELYRRGTRTPTPDQIQQIAAYLAQFGKIEGKNVFYWFQNHKARERQKRRREMAASHLPDRQHDCKTLDNYKESVMRRTSDYEVKNPKKKWAPLLDCQESANPMHRATRAERETQFEERESQQRRSTVGRHGYDMNFIISSQTLIQTRTLSDPKLSNTHYGMLLTPTKEGFSHLEDQRRESKTLNLFPPQYGSDCDANSITGEDTEEPIPTRDKNFAPNQFFEFLRLKKY